MTLRSRRLRPRWCLGESRRSADCEVDREPLGARTTGMTPTRSAAQREASFCTCNRASSGLCFRRGIRCPADAWFATAGGLGWALKLATLPRLFSLTRVATKLETARLVLRTNERAILTTGLRCSAIRRSCCSWLRGLTRGRGRRRCSSRSSRCDMRWRLSWA